MFKDEVSPELVKATASSVAASSKASRIEDEVVALFDAFHDRLARYVLALGLVAPDAEEVIQEVFLALFRHLQRGRPRNNLRAWLFAVAHNLALKQRQRHRRHHEIFLAYDGSMVENLHADSSLTPEERLMRLERRRRAQAVWNALPEQDRQCLSLRAEGLTYREISEVLGMSLGSISISLTRSLERFARADGR